MFDDQVAGEKLARRLALLAALDLGDALGRDEHFEDDVAHLLGLDALHRFVVHLVLLSGEHVHDVPLIFWCENGSHISADG